MQTEEQKKETPQQNGEVTEKENQERNQGAWNGHTEDGEQDAEKQGGSLATDGPVSENEAGRGADLTDTADDAE